MEWTDEIDRIIRQQLVVDVPVTSSSLLAEDLGMDSLNRVQFICDIEEEFGILFAIEDLMSENFRTVQDVYDMVKRYCG